MKIGIIAGLNIFLFFFNKYITGEKYKYPASYLWGAFLVSNIWLVWLSGVANLTDFVIYGFLTMVLWVMICIDYKYHIIPDKLNLCVFIIGLLHLIIKRNNIVFFILGSIIAGGLFLLLAFITNGGFGGGDIKLMFGLGLIFGIYTMCYLIWLSFLIAGVSAIGIVFYEFIRQWIKERKRLTFKRELFKREIALGPSIGMATFIIIALQNLDRL